MATPTLHRRSARLRSIATFAGGLVIAMGCLVLLGWIFDIERMRSVALGLTAMNPATALALIIAGTALLLLRDEPVPRRRREIAQALAVMLIALGLIRLVGYGFGRDDGLVDQLLFRAKLDAYDPPNRIAPNTAFNLLLLGITLLTIDAQTRHGRRPAQVLAIVFGLIALTAIIGYAYQALSLTQFQGHIPMALNTALAFVVLCVGVFCARPDRGLMAVITSDESGGAMARRLLPAAIIIPAVLGYFLEVLLGTSLFVILIMVTMSGLIWISAASLNRSDRKRHLAETALLAERHLLHTLLDNLPDHIYFKDSESRFTRVNRAQARCFGLTDPSEAIGKRDRDFFAYEHASQAELDERHVMLTGLPLIDEEEKETWADGRETWVSTTKMPFHDAEGRVIGTFGISRDITLRKRAEQALRASREQSRLVVDTAHDAYVAMDDEGRIVEWNLQAETTFGWSREEAIGKLVAETIIPPRYREAHARGLRHFLTTGEGPVLNQRIEIFAVDRDGREFPVELSITPLPVGSTFLFNAFVHDITNRKRAEQELQHARGAAETANRAKSEFLANMSHEIRTPMNAVIGMTELVLDTQLDRLQREYLKMVQESAESLMTLINDILDFSKIEAGKLDLEAIPFSLRERLGDSIKLLAFRAHGKGLELACRVHPDVPDGVVGDPGRLRQIVVNLIGNAIKFTEKGEVVLSVERAEKGQGSGIRSQESEIAPTISADSCPLTPDSCHLHFIVRDTGIGIPPDKVSALFRAFEQVDASTTRKYGGTGLGLAISKRLVQLLGGEIWVESELGRGSQFHFTAQFPLADQMLAKAPRVEAAWDRDVSVLIVDDNATNRLILEETVRSWGMTSAAATSAHEALRMLQEAHERQQPFGILLADIHMPEVDGFTLVEWLRQDERFHETIVIVLTSGSQHGDLNRSKSLRIAAHLMKPVKPSELFDAIGASLGVTALEDKAVETLHQLPPLRVLLAEDSHVNQKLAVGLLGKYGHSITIANNGKEAVQLCNSQHFDAVLMDVQMPEMDGLEATAVIRAQEVGTGRRIPIVAMTAGAMHGDREVCLEAGMDGYIAKPIRAQELFETLGRVLRCDASVTVEPISRADGQSVDIAAAIESIGGDPALFADVARAFRDEAPQLMAAIAIAVAAGDPAGLVRPAHTLKGALLSVSANTAAELAQRLEQMARANDLAGAHQTLENLQNELQSVQASLENFAQESLSK